MGDSERDEVPMLLSRDDRSSDESTGSQSWRLPTTSRSVSISIPTESNESYLSPAILFNHTGPLRSDGRLPVAHISSSLYARSKPDIPVRANQDVERSKPDIPVQASQGVARSKPDTPVQASQGVSTGNNLAERLADKFGSLNGRDQKNLSRDDHTSKNEHLIRSGPLGICNDPYCTTCPAYYKIKPQERYSKLSDLFDHKFHNILHGDAKSWARSLLSVLHQCIPGIMNPHTYVVQQWNQFFAISCLFAIFVDPLFFFLLSVSQESKCIYINMPVTTTIVVVRSITDLIYLLNMILQFRLAYVAPESRVVGAGVLVDQPMKIALHYLRGYFLIDMFVVGPLPQMMILFVLPNYLGYSGANNAKNILRTAVLLQYILRLYRFLPLVIGQSSDGFIFESAWANFVMNLLTFVLAGHIVGSCWYLFGLQRVNQCLRKACKDTGIESCTDFIDCGHGHADKRFFSNPLWKNWTDNVNATACFMKDSFPYGIYKEAVNLTTERSVGKRYLYSLFWGFQQISTLAGNQVPSYDVCEVFFNMSIIGSGLLLFALLIGNMQNFLQALGRRKLEMQLRRRDVEQWMRHRRLPEELKSRVRQAERYSWAATRGVNEEMLLENLPEDLQRDIRGHLFKFVKKVRIFSLMDKPILDAICERLRQKTYINGSNILYYGGPIEKMIFIVRGKMESIAEDGTGVPLSEGDVCGEELLTWCLEHSSVNRDGRNIRNSGQRLLSNRIVRCLTNVEAFALQESDIEEVTNRFARFLRNPRVQGAIRYESPYWRSLAATTIQVAWRYWKKRLYRVASSEADYRSP